MKRFWGVIAILMIVVPWAFLAAHLQEATSLNAVTDKFKARIPPPPQLSADDLYSQLGRAHAQIEIQQKYISQLQQELTAAQALCEKPEAEKENK